MSHKLRKDIRNIHNTFIYHSPQPDTITNGTDSRLKLQYVCNVCNT